jgi:hypothetical protein
MPAVQSRLAFEPLRSVAIAAGYSNLGTPLAHPIRMFKITNNSTADITVSYDGGVTDHEFLPANSFLLLDITSNKVWDCQFCLATGTQVAVKGAGAGTVYLSVYYAT